MCPGQVVKILPAFLAPNPDHGCAAHVQNPVLIMKSSIPPPTTNMEEQTYARVFGKFCKSSKKHYGASAHRAGVHAVTCDGMTKLAAVTVAICKCSRAELIRTECTRERR